METGLRGIEEAITVTVQIHCGRGMTPACGWGPALFLNRGVGGSTEVGS